MDGLPATYLVPTAASFSGPSGDLVLGPGFTQSTKAFKLKSMTLPDFGTYMVSIGGLSGEYGFARLKGRLKVPRARTKHVMP